MNFVLSTLGLMFVLEYDEHLMSCSADLVVSVNIATYVYYVNGQYYIL